MNIQETYLPNKETHPHLKDVSKAYILDHRYLVYLTYFTRNGIPSVHLRVRYTDKKLKDIPYGELFEIKNVILGKDVQAIMTFPKKDDHINNSHTYHLFTWENIDAPNLKTMYDYGHKQIGDHLNLSKDQIRETNHNYTNYPHVIVIPSLGLNPIAKCGHPECNNPGVCKGFCPAHCECLS